MNNMGFNALQKEEIKKLISDFAVAYRMTPKPVRDKELCPQNYRLFSCYSKVYLYLRTHATSNRVYEDLYLLGADKAKCYDYLLSLYQTLVNEIVLPKWEEKNILYVYRGNNSCISRRHDLINATAVLLGLKNENIKLNVQYCPQCRKFYIGETAFLRYRELYGAIIGNIKFETTGAYNNQDSLAEESPLMLCGYTVNQQTGYSDSTRQYIISRLIDKGILSKTKIIDYLQYFIKRNGRKLGNELALQKWKSDLDFTQQYNMHQQPVVGIIAIRRYKGKGKHKL